MPDTTDQHRAGVSTAMHALRDTNAGELATNPDAHVAVTGNQYYPATLGQKLMEVCQNEGHARVFAPSKQSAAMIDSLLSCPVKEQTPRGAVPYRSVSPLRTSNGGRIVQEPDNPQPEVEFIAGEGTALTWDNDTVLLPLESDREQATFTDLPTGVFIAHQADDGTDGVLLETGAGEEVDRVATLDALDNEYATVWDWFRPDRITFECDVTIHYPAEDNDEELVTYRKQPLEDPEKPLLWRFLEQATVQSDGDHLRKEAVIARYLAWRTGFAGPLPSRENIAAEFESYGDIKQIHDGENGLSQVLCDRVWRWKPVVSRQP